jgi:hypothetical protein
VIFILFENKTVLTHINEELDAIFFNTGLPIKFISTLSKNVQRIHTLDSKFNGNSFSSFGDKVEKSMTAS